MGLTKDSTGLNALDCFLLQNTNSYMTVALAGNPNVGKSTLFNNITGMHQHTGNWPGKTVTGAVGNCTHKEKSITFVDLPGCYSLLSHSPEEEVARDFIEKGNPDVTVVVCDATCLERNLILALQTIYVTNKVIVCINLIDEAQKKGIEVDVKKLSKELGVPVVVTSARNGLGIDELLEKITDNNFEASKIEKKEITQTVELAADITKKVITLKNEDYLERDRKIDKILTGKFAIPMMLLMLLGVFWITITGANEISEVLSSALFKTEEWLHIALEYIGCPKVLNEMIVFGGYRMLIWVVSVMLPPMAIFFPLFTLLEDLGYLPRVAFNLDRCFKSCGSCGKQALTMCMGFGCNAAGVVGARIIDSERERLIAIVTNSFVPCNGRFPALIGIITIFIVGGTGIFFQNILPSLVLTIVISVGVGMTLLASKFLSKTLLSGAMSSFVLELPPYRRPQVGKVIVRSIFDRTLFVLARAVVSAIPAGLLLWVFANVSLDGKTLMAIFAEILNPIGRFMGLDGIILMAFVLGFPANETVVPIMIMGYLSGNVLSDSVSLAQIKDVLILNGWNMVTAINTLIFFLFHWPCATTLITVYKETKSLKWTILSFLLPTTIGFLLCTGVNLIF